MKDLAIEMDTHQLQRVIEKLESYDFKAEGKNFSMFMGRKAADEIPRVLGRLAIAHSLSNQINLISGGVQNTARVIVAGETMIELNHLLKQMGD